MVKLTKHGINRINERVGTEYEEKNLINKVKQYGHPIHSFNGDFYDYLLNKTNKGGKLKVYKNMIYVLSSNKKNFLTVYPVPSKFIPIEQYLLDHNMSNLIYYPKYYINKEISIRSINDIIVKGILKNVNFVNNKTTELLIQTYNNYYLTLAIEEVKSILFDDEVIYDEYLEIFKD